VTNPYADPACPECGGRGFIYKSSMLDGGSYCECTLDGLRLDNMNRIWPSLPDAKEVKRFREKPDLGRFIQSSAWITAPVPLFKAHLKGLAYNMPTIWHARVRTDAELLDAWFGTAKAQGVKIFDLEIEKSTVRAIDIRDLVEPPDLCIIVMGVKKLPNKEAPGSLGEAISYRAHLGKPTWVVDQPDLPLDGTHRFFSGEIEQLMRKWPHATLSANGMYVANEVRHPSPVSSTADDIESLIEEDEEEEDSFEEEEDTAPTTSTTNSLLHTVSVGNEKPKYKGKKKSWGKR